MGGAMRKMGVYLGLLEDTERYDDDYDYGAPDQGVPPQHGYHDDRSRQAQVAQLADRRRPVASPVAAVSTPQVTELARITTLHPTTYNDARAVGEAFRAGVPVIMNLSEMDDADAKRLVDFAAGLIFAVHGSIDRVTAKVFLLCPPNVEVGMEEKATLVENGFFNQS
ncbi:cell division protein SepF [Nocardioides marmoribigeumensis]|jgi:cell division inhibitor SepF|nr:cell division protein SepF [Nocardioides marmoribigeumensis]